LTEDQLPAPDSIYEHGTPVKGRRSCRAALDSDQSAVSGFAFFGDSFLDGSHYSSRFGVP